MASGVKAKIVADFIAASSNHLGTKRFHEGSGIWHPNLGQGCHYWQQGLVAKIGTKREIAPLSEAPPKWSIEIIFGDNGWTKN
jgi:hypothetical protein